MNRFVRMFQILTVIPLMSAALASCGGNNADIEEVVGADAVNVDADLSAVSDAPVTLEASALRLPDWLDARGGHSVIWTGSQLVVWGGWSDETGQEVFDDGARYDPMRDEWTALSAGPLQGRGFHSAEWTGTEMIVVGGRGSGGVARADSAAYDPATDSWRLLPPSELVEQAFAHEATESVWAGDRLVLWDRQKDRVLSLRPDGDRWVELPATGLLDAATLGALRWTGTELVALSGDGPLNAATYRLGDSEGSWEPLPPIDYDDPFPTNSVVLGQQLVVWARDGSMAPTYAFDSAARVWREGAPIPIAACEGHSEPLVTTVGALVLDACGEPSGSGGAALLSVDTQTWRAVEIGEVQLVELGEAVWAGNEGLVVQTTCCYGSGGAPFEWSAVRLQIRAP